MSDNKEILYQTPNDTYVSREGSINGWEVIEDSDWIISASGRGDPNEVKTLLKLRAGQIGANTVLNLTYSKSTGSESGTGKGIHYYTIHHFYGRPVNIGKKKKSGIPKENAITRINAIADSLKRELNSQFETNKYLTVILLMILGIVVLATTTAVDSMAVKILCFIGEFFIGMLILRLWSDPGDWLQKRD